MGRMRTAAAAVDELLSIDPLSPVKRHTIDMWARQGVIYSVKVGNRRLISMDSLLAFLSGDVQPIMNTTALQSPQRGGIRRIEP